MQTYSGSGARLGLLPVAGTQSFQHLIDWLLVQLGGHEGVLDGRHGADLKQKRVVLKAKQASEQNSAHHIQDTKSSCSQKLIECGSQQTVAV